jgi:hypothetical protein
MKRSRAVLIVLLNGTAMVAGCSGGPALPALKLSSEASVLPISTAEAYTRIARGAMSCWFGTRGRLARSHLFHADADPPARGGAVEITIHERAFDQPKPLGYKAFRVSLKKGAEHTHIEVENLRLPDAVAQPMRSEVFAWAGGANGCIGDAAAQTGGTLPVSPALTGWSKPKQ